MNTYGDRNRVLLSMGFSSYQEYLLSPLWASIRERALIEHGSICRLCGEKATQFHHLGYGRDVLAGRTLHQLVPLCSPCHERVEFEPRARKRTLIEAHRAYVRLWKRVKKKTPWGRKVGKCVQCGHKARKHMKLCRKCQKKLNAFIESDNPR